jgi:hypothetical protein
MELHDKLIILYITNSIAILFANFILILRKLLNLSLKKQVCIYFYSNNKNINL